MTDELTDVQRGMLEDEQFHIDGWCSKATKDAALDLQQRGLIECVEVTEESQYTALNFSITDAGRKALVS